MVKYRKLFTGCGLAIISCVMWLVSACSQPANNGDQVATTVSPLPNSTTTEPSTLSNSTTIINQATTTEPPTASNSTTTDTPTTTTTPPVVSSSTPTEATTTTADINSAYDINNYSLVIDGLVNTPLSLSFKQILSYPTVTENAELICPGVEDVTNDWTGVPVSTLLKAADPTSEASEVIFTSNDGYSIQLPLNSALQDSVFLAYQVDGKTTLETRGYPLRLVLKWSPGFQWVTWVTKIEVQPALVSFLNSSSLFQNLPNKILSSGSKLCSCLLLAVTDQSKSMNQKPL